MGKTVATGAVRTTPQELLQYVSLEDLQELQQITEKLALMVPDGARLVFRPTPPGAATAAHCGTGAAGSNCLINATFLLRASETLILNVSMRNAQTRARTRTHTDARTCAHTRTHARSPHHTTHPPSVLWVLVVLSSVPSFQCFRHLTFPPLGGAAFPSSCCVVVPSTPPPFELGCLPSPTPPSPWSGTTFLHPPLGWWCSLPPFCWWCCFPSSKRTRNSVN